MPPSPVAARDAATPAAGTAAFREAGLVLGLALLRVRTPRAYWTIAILFGAIAPTLGAGVIAMVKGEPLQPTPILLIVGLLVNGAWGLATAVFYRWLERWRATSASSRA